MKQTPVRVCEWHVWPSAWQTAKRQISDWRIRLVNESNMSACTYFCTLTLDEQSIGEHPEPDIQFLAKFFKRIRTNLRRKHKYQGKLKFFWVSEYGEQTSRLHYHVLLMLSEYISQDDMRAIFASNWYYGFTSVSSLRGMAGVYYTTKYVCKKFFAKFAKSQSYGIGKSWLLANLSTYLDQLRHGIVPTVASGEYRKPLPRYYKKYIVDKYPEYKQVFEDVTKEILNKRDIGHSTLCAMTKKCFVHLDRVNKQLFYGLGGLVMRGVNPDCPDGDDVLVDVSPLIANHLYVNQRIDYYINLHKQGGISFNDLRLRI